MGWQVLQLLISEVLKCDLEHFGLGSPSLKSVALVLLESRARGVEEVGERPPWFLPDFRGHWASVLGQLGKSPPHLFCSSPLGVTPSSLVGSFLGIQVGWLQPGCCPQPKEASGKVWYTIGNCSSNLLCWVLYRISPMCCRKLMIMVTTS